MSLHDHFWDAITYVFQSLNRKEIDMTHYLFVDGQVVTVQKWSETLHFAKGTWGYTPNDPMASWYHLDPPRWITAPRYKVPKEFVTELFLLGVPIQE